MFASLTRSPSDPAIWRWWLLSLRLPPTDGVSPAGGARCVRSTALRPPDQTGAAHHRPRTEAVEQQRQSIDALADDRRSHGRLRRPSRTAGGAARCGRDRDHLDPGQPAAEIRGPTRPAAAAPIRSTLAPQYARHPFLPLGPPPLRPPRRPPRRTSPPPAC